MKRVLWFLWLLVTSVCLAGHVEAQEQVATNGEPQTLKATHYFVDGSGGRTIGEVVGLQDYVWEEVTGRYPSFGYDLRTYWFKLSLPAEASSQLLHVQYPLLDALDIYFMREGR